MTKLTKKQLSEKMNMLMFVLNDSHGAVGTTEQTYAMQAIQRRGRDLISALEGDLNAHAAKLSGEAESLVDRSTRHIENMRLRIQRGERF